MMWHTSHRYDPRALPLADRHYNRQKPGTPQFVPPGRNLVLLTERADALWVTTWPRAEYIREAVAATRAKYGEPPDLGMVTFVDAAKVRRKRDPGRCYLRAGFRCVGRTKERGYIALQLLPLDMPPPVAARGAQLFLTGAQA
jgi:hypothetical protein